MEKILILAILSLRCFALWSEFLDFRATQTEISQTILLKKEIHRFQDCMNVTVAFADDEYIDIAANWIMLHPPSKCILLFVTPIGFEILKDYDGVVLLSVSFMSKVREVDMSRISRLHFFRYHVVYFLLDRNFSVHLTDVDVISCYRQWDYIQQHYQYFDIAGARGIHPYRASNTSIFGSLTAGFIFMKPTSFTLNLLRTVLDQPVGSGTHFDEQTILNKALRDTYLNNTSETKVLEDGSVSVTASSNVNIIYLSRHLFPIGAHSFHFISTHFCAPLPGRYSLRGFSSPIVLHPYEVSKLAKAKKRWLSLMSFWALTKSPLLEQNEMSNRQPTCHRHLFCRQIHLDSHSKIED
jgi:hypothetical protein